MQHKFQVQTDVSRLYRAAIQNVRNSIRQEDELDEVAAYYTAGAVEDFGICLRERPDLVRKAGKVAIKLPFKIEHVGYYASEYPETLTEQALLLRLVQIEQTKRVQFWGERLDVSLMEHDRSTEATRAAHLAIVDLTNSLIPPDAPAA